MVPQELLLALSQMNLDSSQLSDQELIDLIDPLEKAHVTIHNLLITARMQKLKQDFGERDTDIYVVTYPKSGTTLMQMLLY